MTDTEKSAVIYEVLSKLEGVGTDHEADIVEELSCKAGYKWKCWAETHPNGRECCWVNGAEDAVCGDCGSPKPKEGSSD
jgi:hypothetical protein